MKEIKVLEEVSFDVPERSIFGFLGPNGAGKTTLIHLIVGIRQPTGGSISWKGVPVTNPDVKDSIGYLPERPYFYDHLTGLEVLEYFGALSGLSRKQVRDRADHVLKKVNMLRARDLTLNKFSKGMLQRIGIAQAILHEPELLILDEPMSGLDPAGRKEMRELILELSGEGRTVFFSSHVIPDIEAICDRVAIVKKGRLEDTGLIAKFLQMGVRGYEILVQSGTPVSLTKVSGINESHTSGEIQRLKTDGLVPLEKILSQLIESKAQVLSVIPIKNSLEDYFDHQDEKPNEKQAGAP